VTVPLHLGPGSEVPGWVEDLERTAFGKPWGDLDDGEHLWTVAFGGFARWQVIPLAQEAELIRIAVAPSLRRTGLGRTLLRHSQAKLTRMDVLALHLEVRVGNAAARALYEQEGWVFQGLRKGYYRDGEDAALYRRDL
jgi:ribosomal-protein-alanine N-acetyltransferase